MSERNILHIDLDAFFASVEQLDHPEYRGKPVIVGGLPGDRRSVVSTASYEARKYGVHSAMPTARAYELCPNGIYLRGRMARYHELSKQVMRIFMDFSPDMRQMSVDEAFIDITGTELLFGKPEDTARAIQERVLAETGLTVSIGLAPNRYLAKIASGLNKPKGLTVVPAGGEEAFMLSLPLDKLWGVGGKTRNRLVSLGFRSISDIHAASLQGLTHLFGECTGDFLYNAVRGREAAGFAEEPKSRSISSEETYSFDLTDRDAIRTALLNLSFTVFFRLLDEGCCSKTVHLKIRYEDFTTVNIQETLPRYVSSTDDLFERVTALFDKKYDRTRGIRLLGVGLQNLEQGTHGEQGELFDFGEGKKRAVEEAVLSLNKKNPKNSVKKARQFLPALLLFAGLALCRPAPRRAFAERFPDVLSETEPVSVYEYTNGDTTAEFFADGTWESTLTGGASLTFSPGKPTAFSLPPLVYKQTVDLSLWFLLQNSWYFEAAFADDLEKSTVALGYIGEGAVRHARVGNRGIVFPEHFSLNATGYTSGGGDAEAPGLMLTLRTESLAADTMLRFEQVMPLSKTFRGMNEETTATLALGEWERGRSFTLPNAGSVAGIAELYEEDAGGAFFGADGRRYRKVPPEEYLLFPSRAEVSLQKPAAGAIVARFTDTGKTAFLEGLPPFIEDVEDAFSPTDILRYEGNRYTAIAMSFEEASSVPEPLPASSSACVFLYRPFSFSPFENADTYLFSNVAAPESARVTDASTGGNRGRYVCTVRESSVFDASGTVRVRVSPEKPTARPRGAAERYPFCGEHPLVYAGSGTTETLTQTTGTEITLYAYASANQYDIGTNAIPGSVRAYRNGNPEASTYNGDTGTVTLAIPAGGYDTVKIFWDEYDSTSRLPVLHSATGITWKPMWGKEALSFDTAFTTRWPLITSKAFSEPDTFYQGETALALGGRYEAGNADTGRLTVESSVSGTYTVPDVTGTLRIEGFDDSRAASLYLGESPFVKHPEHFVPALQKRPGASGADTPPVLQKSLRAQSTVKTGRESGITGYAASVTPDFSRTQSGESAFGAQNGPPLWVAETIKLPQARTLLPEAQEFTLPMRFSLAVGEKDKARAAAELENLSVYLQLGATADENTLFETAPIPTWKISTTSTTTGSGGSPSPAQNAGLADVQKPLVLSPESGYNAVWQDVCVRLTAEDRLRLQNTQNLRLIVVYSGSAENADFVRGSISIAGKKDALTGLTVQAEGKNTSFFSATVGAPPEPLPADIAALQEKSANTALRVKFSPEQPARPSTVTTRSSVGTPSLESYNELSFFVLVPQNRVSPDIVLSLLDDTGEAVLSIPLPREELEASKGGWHRVVHPLTQGEKALLAEKPPVTRVLAATRPEESVLVAGERDLPAEVYYDEFLAEGTEGAFGLRDKTSVRVERKAALFSIGKYRFFEGNAVDASFSAATRTGKAALETTVPFVSLSGNISLGTDSASNITMAGAAYIVSTTPTTPVTKAVALKEEFLTTASERRLYKKDALTLTLPDWTPALAATLKAESAAKQSASDGRQDFIAGFEADIGKKDAEAVGPLRFGAEVNLAETNADKAYRAGKASVGALQWSLGSFSAAERTEKLLLSLSLALPALGATPEVSVSVTQNAVQSGAEQKTLTALAGTLSIPIKIKQCVLTLTAGETATVSSPDLPSGEGLPRSAYKADATLAADRIPLLSNTFRHWPLQDLVCGKNDEPPKLLGAEELLSTASVYGVSLTRPASLTPLDWLVPATATLSIGKNTEATSFDTKGGIAAKGSFVFTALNSFGASGFFPLFKFYEQDEFVHTFSFSVLNGTPTLSGNGTLRLLFAGGGEFLSALDYQWTTGKELFIEEDVSWKHCPNETTEHTEGLLVSWERANAATASGTFFMQVRHATKKSFGERISVKLGGSLGMRVTPNATTLSGTLSVGGKLDYSR